MMNAAVKYPFADEFERLYTRLRQKEGRNYTDEEVANLPSINKAHPNYKEWKTRERSFKRLVSYIKGKNVQLNILETGCGNGWLSAQLASDIKGIIIATDINKTELAQAKRVFADKINLSFIEGDIRNIHFENKFDIIIFAASIQYFSSFEEITRVALSLLNKGGEIHILDTYFYKADEIENARQRSEEHYRSIGYEGMAECYFHHAVDSLKQFNYKILSDPTVFKNRFFGNRDPFPWICITNT
jgi:ubiquinone/menaquinone biosynthesis C-methylase UbiE